VWLLAALVAAAAAYAASARDQLLAPAVARFVTAAPPGETDRAGRSAAPVLLEGILAEDAARVDGGVRLTVDVDRARDAAGWHSTRGRVQVLVAGSLAGPVLEHWSAGRRLQAPVLLRRLHTLQNPGGPSPRRQALTRGVILAGTIKSAALVDIAPGAWWDEAAARARDYARRQTARWIAPIDPLSAAVVTAILIGDRAGLPIATTERLQAAGTYHVIAISGGNVALVVLIGLGLVRLAVRAHRVRMVAAIGLVAAYGWVVGGDPSVSRAVVAACVYLACRGAGLSAAPIDVLGLVVLIVLAANPMLSLDVGAWLSFGAALGILLGASRIGSWLGGAGTGTSTTRSTVGRPMVMLFSATVAVELMLLPVNASIFSRLGVAGLLLNFVAIPSMAVVQIAGILLMLVATWWESAAWGAAWAAHLAVTALVGSARLVDVAPWLSWRVPPPSALWVVAYYTAGGLAIAGVVRSTGWRLVPAGAALISALVLLTAPAVEQSAPRRGWLRATMLDVGQGEAILVQFPAGQSLLVDAGGVPSGFDLGGRVVVRALWALGVRRLDWLAFTHADLDHIDGARAVAAILRPREVWEGTPVPPDSRREALRTFAASRGIAWRRLQRGDTLEIGSVALSILHPPLPDWERQHVRNDDSLVIQLRYGEVELLLTGDIGRATEAQLALADESGGGRLRVLKVAHHGSRTSTSAEFLNRTSPQLALISAGRGNLFGHPAPDVTSRLLAAGAELFRTDQDGAIRLESNGREVRVATMTGRRRVFSAWPLAGAGASRAGVSPAVSTPAP
jgi:competence protein ComEC